MTTTKRSKRLLPLPLPPPSPPPPPLPSSSSSTSSSSKRRKTAAYENEESKLEEKDEEKEEKEEGQQPAAVNPPDVHADLDDEAQVDDDNNGPGLMKELLRAVHARPKKETHKDFTEERWLLGISKSNDWWLRVERLEVDKVFERLDIQPSLMEYYRDIDLWLPDLRWGTMPPSPCCSSAKSFRFHCWRDNLRASRKCKRCLKYQQLNGSAPLAATCKGTGDVRVL